MKANIRQITCLLLQYVIYICAMDNLHFGIKTSNVPYAGSDTTVELTLSWNKLNWNCIIEPYSYNTLYTCSTLSPNTTKSISETDDFSLQITYEGDTMIIDSIIVMDQNSNSFYEITEFCLSDYFAAPQTAITDYSLGIHCNTWTKRQKYSDILLGTTSTKQKSIIIDFDENILNYANQSMEGKVKPDIVTSISFFVHGTTIATVNFALYWDTFIYYGSLQPTTRATYVIDSFSTILDCEHGDSAFKMYVDCLSTDDVGIDWILIRSGGYYYQITTFDGNSYLYVDIDRYGAYKEIYLTNNFLLFANSGNVPLQSVIDTNFLDERNIVCNESSYSEITTDTPVINVTHNNSQCGVIKHVNWEQWIQQGDNYEDKPSISYDLNVYQENNNYNDIFMNIDIFLDYLGYSYRTENEYGYGTSYFISFYSFDSTNNQIDRPGNCDNRNIKLYQNKTWKQYWNYSKSWYMQQEIGSDTHLAYPSSQFWTLTPDDSDTNCINQIHYSAQFSLNELLECKTYDNNLLIDTVTNDKWINITGDLYVSVLTPFSMDLETFKYYQYQLLSAPFTINIPKSIYFLDTFNVFLFSATVIAVYKETEHDFNIIILTESAEYIQLANLILITSPNNNQNINLFNNIQIDNDCISDKNYICSQIWKIKATNVECPYTFDGTYGFQWHAVCSNDTLCQQYLQQNGNIVTLTTNLSFTDNICDPEIWSINFNGMINYYDDNNYITEKEDGFEYIIGIDRVYVELVVDVPIETNYSIFDVEAYNIWLCTTTLETQLYSDPNDIENTGCFDPRVTGLYHIIKDKNELFTADAQHEISDRTNVARFSFIIPSNVNNDKIYIEIQAKLSLMDNNNRTQTITPRLLLSSKDTASQISHFIDYIFVKSENRNNQTTQIDNKSYFIVVVIILTIIIIILCLIVMYCMVKKNKYSKIKESNKEITTQMSTHQTNHNPSIIEINSNEN
eukprot:62862_1